QEIVLDERDAIGGNGDVADRMPGALEHRPRDVDADEPPHVRKRVKIAARPASEVQDVDRPGEALANRAEPAAETRHRLPLARRSVVRTIARGVRLGIEAGRARAPACRLRVRLLDRHACFRATNPLTPATRNKRRANPGKNGHSTRSVSTRFHGRRGTPVSIGWTTCSISRRLAASALSSPAIVKLKSMCWYGVKIAVHSGHTTKLGRSSSGTLARRRPPGFNTRAISARPAAKSSGNRCSSVSVQITRSHDAASRPVALIEPT